MGRVFRKAFRILGLAESKGRWVMGQDFHGDFQVLVTWFLTRGYARAYHELLQGLRYANESLTHS